MRIILIATTDLAAGRADDLSRLVRSLEDQCRGSAVDLRLLLLVQNATPDRLSALGPLPAFAEVTATAGRMPLSHARNRLLGPLLRSGALTADALVCFPDDDCWYVPGHLAGLGALFDADARLGFWFCDFGETPHGPGDAMAGRQARARDVVRTAASITLAVRGDIAATIGPFDESLGLGTANSGGEDIDYALRAFLASPVTRVVPAPLMGHRDRARGPSAAYFRGCLMALAKHARRHGGIAFELARKVAVGGVLVWRGGLSASGLAAALRDAVAGTTPSPQGTLPRTPSSL